MNTFGMWNNQLGTPIKGALTLREQSFLSECGKFVKATGDIVEFGCWLGCSTVLLNRHLNGDDERHFVYDRFQVEPWMRLQGESFRRLFDQNTRECRNLRIRQNDILNERWPGGPIKLMLIDAFKTNELIRHGVQHWFEHLAVGSLIVDQDFLWKPPLYSLMHLIMYRLRGYMEPAWACDGLLSFVVTSKIKLHPEIFNHHSIMYEMAQAYGYFNDHLQRCCDNNSA